MFHMVVVTFPTNWYLHQWISWNISKLSMKTVQAHLIIGTILVQDFFPKRPHFPGKRQNWIRSLSRSERCSKHIEKYTSFCVEAAWPPVIHLFYMDWRWTRSSNPIIDYWYLTRKLRGAPQDRALGTRPSQVSRVKYRIWKPCLSSVHWK